MSTNNSVQETLKSAFGIIETARQKLVAEIQSLKQQETKLTGDLKNITDVLAAAEKIGPVTLLSEDTVISDLQSVGGIRVQILAPAAGWGQMTAWECIQEIFYQKNGLTSNPREVSQITGKREASVKSCFYDYASKGCLMKNSDGWSIKPKVLRQYTASRNVVLSTAPQATPAR